MYLLTQPFISDHFWPWINVINTIQPVQCNRVTQKVIALEGRVDPENTATSTSTLNVVQENGNDWYLSAEELGQEILVEKYLVYPIFTGRLDRADNF